MKLKDTDHVDLKLIPSQLWKLPQVDQHVVDIKETVHAALKSNDVEVDPQIRSYMKGLSSWEFCGATFDDGRKIPMFVTHYALLETQEQHLRRTLPMSLLMYNVYMAVAHSGKSIDTILQSSPEVRAEFFAACMSVTHDPGIVSYERDFTLEVNMGFFSRRPQLCKKTTEDMVWMFFF